MSTTSRRADARTFEAGVLLVAGGAGLLLVSLFLEWYPPGLDAWEIFEVWDLVLAVLGAGALVAAASRLGFGPPRPVKVVVSRSTAAVVIVVYTILNPPPAVAGVAGGPGIGVWLALASSLLMALGALLSFSDVSVAFTLDERSAPGAPRPDPGPLD